MNASEQDVQPTQLTPDEKLCKRYIDLGRIASDADKERDLLKKGEIEPAMLEDGQVFSVDGQRLSFQYEVRNSFDVSSALESGDLTPEIAARHTRPTYIRKLVVKKQKDETAEAAAQQAIFRQSRADTIFDLLGDAVAWVEDEVLKEQIKAALTA